MKIQIHLPRQSEAEIEPALEDDITVLPKFYKKSGFVNFLYITTITAKGKETRHVLTVNASNGKLLLNSLVEVMPDCDNPNKREKKDAESSGQTDDEAVQDENVLGTAGN